MKPGNFSCFFGVLALAILASASASPPETSDSETRTVVVVNPQAGSCPTEAASQCTLFCKYAGTNESLCNPWSSLFANGFSCNCKQQSSLNSTDSTNSTRFSEEQFENLSSNELDTRTIPTLCSSSLYQACNQFCQKYLNACISTVNSVKPSASSALCTCGLF